MRPASTSARRLISGSGGYSRLAAAVAGGAIAAAATIALVAAPRATAATHFYPSHISQTVMPSSGLVGTTLRDEITPGKNKGLTGHNPTTKPTSSGYVEFFLYGPNDTQCTGTPVYDSGQLAVDSHRQAHSGAVVADKPGIWTWVLKYSGDSDNLGSTTGCTGAVTISAPPPAGQGPGSGTLGLSIGTPDTGAAG